MIHQLPLNIQLTDDATLQNFYWDRDPEIHQAIRQLVTLKGEPFLYVWGSSGSGKTHILQATCHAVTSHDTAIYIPLQECINQSPKILEGIEQVSLVCLDNIEVIAGNSEWEEAVFILFNQIRSMGGYLLISADQPPATLPIQLPDLKSRLSWGVTYQIHTLHDEAKADLLKHRAEQRGLHLDSAVSHFLLQRCDRHPADLFKILDQLDQASLSQKRKITIPFIKQILDL